MSDEKNPIAPKSLLAGKDAWLPRRINYYEEILRRRLKKTAQVSNGYKIRKNVAYNLQYVEYLEQTLTQLGLTGVLRSMTWKTYVITATSIIEAVFYYLVKESETRLVKEWVEVDERKTNYDQKSEDPARMRVITEKLRHVDIRTDIKLNQLSLKVEKNKLLGETSTYSKVNALRKLRNKVHLYASDDATQMDTDWNAFNSSDYLLAKEVLAEILLKANIFTSGELEEVGLVERPEPTKPSNGPP